MSFIEEQRQKQVIDAAIAVLARNGMAKTSLSRIAAEAGISKSIISYHFEGKEQLFAQLFMTISYRIEAALVPEIDKASSSWERIAAYMEGQLAYMKSHREELLAIGHIALSYVGTGATPDYITKTASEEHILLRGWLLEGQADGSFVDFDIDVMAATISGAIESMLRRWASQPDTNLDHYSSQLIALFCRAVRKEP